MLKLGYIIKFWNTFFPTHISKNIENVETREKNGLSRAIKVIILCLLWYAASSASNIINKIVLNDFGF